MSERVDTVAHMTSPGATTTSAPRSAAWTVWIAWPVLSLSLSIGIGVLTGAFMTPDDPVGSFVDGLRGVGRWATPALDVGFETLGVTATLVVAIGAVTRFSGDWSELTHGAKRILRPVTTVPIALLALMGGFVIPVAVARPGDTSALLVFWGLSGAVVTAGLGVFEVESRQDHLVRREREYDKALLLPRRLRSAAPSRARYVLALLSSWLLLPGAWIAWCGLLNVSWQGGKAFFWSISALCLSLALTRIGWISLQDRTAPRSTKAFGYSVAGAGVLLSAIVGLVFTVEGPLLIGIPFVVLATASAVMVSPRAAARIWPYSVVMRWHTSRSFATLEQEVTPAPQTAAPARRSAPWARWLARISRAAPPR